MQMGAYGHVPKACAADTAFHPRCQSAFQPASRTRPRSDLVPDRSRLSCMRRCRSP